ncbi:MAG: hypothetical protein IT161_10750 [Bryobacterales bacterium]|nr:hypothetical protein [Bryobacterales bacterium]
MAQPSFRARPKVGLLATGHHYYWSQFPGLSQRCGEMLGELRAVLNPWAEVVSPDLVDSPERSAAAGQLLRAAAVDILLVFPLGYTPAMNLLPAVLALDVPVRILNAHRNRSYDYANADTATYLFHEGVCCVPEFAGALVNAGRRFKVRTGAFDDVRFQAEIQADALGAAAARALRNLNIALIGQTYTGMGDMPVDEHRLLRATGRMLVRPEVEEIENAFYDATGGEVAAMCDEFRQIYAVADGVTDEHLRDSARTAVAFDRVITRHGISAFGFYWWGQRPVMTQLRAQSGLAVSRLASLGRPGVTEGDVKSALAMKVFDLLGDGGMFVEFFSIDFDENFVLMGHDGPANVRMSRGRPRLTHLDVHHGKSGHGLGIDFEVLAGPVTLVNLTQFDAGETFKIIYTVADIVPGPVLRIGNPNCRVQLRHPIPEFMDAWCQQGPSHHAVIGQGDHAAALEAFAEAMQFQIVRIGFRESGR